jgi:Flp pilus assembly pilin Flp
MYSVRGLPCSFVRFLQEEDGMSFIECALLASIVAVVAGIGLLALGKAI